MFDATISAAKWKDMRVPGLVGGLTRESTATYYCLLNEGIRARQGGLHSALLLLWSPNFAPTADRRRDGDWPVLAQQLTASI